MIYRRCGKEPRPGFQAHHFIADPAQDVLKVLARPGPAPTHTFGHAGGTRSIPHHGAHRVAVCQRRLCIDKIAPFGDFRVCRCIRGCDAIGGAQGGAGGHGNDLAALQCRAQCCDQVAVDDYKLRAAVIADGAHLFGGGVPVQRDNDRSGLRRGAHDLKLGQIVAHDQCNRDVRPCAHRNQCRRALCCAYFKVGTRGAMIIVCHIYICQWVAPNRCGLLVQSFPIAVAWQWTATFQPQVK